jgi:MFS family permease
MIAKGGVFIGVLVYAFDQDGAAATGLAAIALHVPAVVLAPTLGALSERYRPHRVRLAAMVLQTAAFAVAAFAAFADLATPFVVSAGTIGIAAAASLGPAGAVLRPAIVRSSRELTVANLWTGYAHSVSVFVAPAVATLMLLAGGATAVLAACAAIAGLAFVVSAAGHPADPPGGGAGAHVHALTLMRRSLGAVRLRHGVVGVLTVAGGQFFIVGALDIVIVVAAQTELGLGPSGPGVLSAAFGLGAFVSGLATTLLVERRRLAPLLVVAMAFVAAAAIVLGTALSIVMAFVLLPMMGLARSVLDLLSVVLLQRSADPHSVGSMFAVREMAAGVGLIGGSVTTQVLISRSGVDAALFGIAGFFIVLLLVTWRALRVADDSADVPVVAMSLLRQHPIFAPLPTPALETVARASIELSVEQGDRLIVEGDHGDRFYAVSEGSFAVAHGDVEIATVGRGGGFGEIALLADVPRTATVTAQTRGAVVAIERAPFLVAVTGHDSERQAAWGVAHSVSDGIARADEP